ncbi:MAG: hypothetical protein NVSMB19_10290 [Vulcanimicrobiaceae bacterium]
MALNVFARSFGIGAVAGLRSMTAPAAILAGADSHWTGPARLAAAGELLVDKLPVVPPRLLPAALAARVLSGALCGRTLAKRADGSALLGTVAGAAGSLAGSYGGYYARQYITTHKRVPDWAIALVEDALALGLARVATARP